MKKEEFNLSEKEQALGTLAGASYGTKIYYPEDVKEFIRLLKDKIKHMSVDESMDYYDNCNFADFEREIDKLAGEKLK